MAIILSCRGCGKKIKVDGAFAGGLCRCIHCGALSAVPAAGRRGGANVRRRARPATPGGAEGRTAEAERSGSSPRPATPFEAIGRSAGALTGREKPETPAVAAAETGAAGPERADDGRPIAPTTAVADTVRFRAILSLVLVFFIVVCLGVAVWMVAASRLGGDQEGTGQAADGEQPLAVSGPSCMGVRLGGQRVIYCLDRSNAMTDTYDPVCAAVLRSVRSLEKGVDFRILLLNEAGEGPIWLPWAEVKPDTIEKAVDFLALHMPGGATDLQAGLLAAIHEKPAELCVVTAKGPPFEDLSTAATEAGKKTVRVHTFPLEGLSEGLAELAKRTGGRCRPVSADELNAWLLRPPSE